MRLTLRDKLPFVTITIPYKEAAVDISNVLVDTGSASTVASAGAVAAIGIVPLPGDALYSIRGVGGSEAVFSRKVDYIQVEERRRSDFEIEINGMDYGSRSTGPWAWIPSPRRMP